MFRRVRKSQARRRAQSWHVTTEFDFETRPQTRECELMTPLKGAYYFLLIEYFSSVFSEILPSHREHYTKSRAAISARVGERRCNARRRRMRSRHIPKAVPRRLLGGCLQLVFPPELAVVSSRPSSQMRLITMVGNRRLFGGSAKISRLFALVVLICLGLGSRLVAEDLDRSSTASSS